jgi:hypothetical protein
MSADEISLLKKMRLMSIAHAYHDGIAFGQVKMTDNGAVSTTPNSTLPISKWLFEKTQDTLMNVAFDATEVMLNFLFEKKAQFGEWTASNEYAEVNALLIKTGTEFSKQYTLYHPMRTFFSIRTVIADAQELYMKEALGEDLLAHLLTIDAPDAKLKPCINKLKKALAFFTIKRCCQHYNVRFSHEGFTVLSGEGNFDSADHSGRKNADPVDLDMKIRASEKTGQDFLGLARNELVAYYKRTEAPLASENFKTAFDAGPLKSYVDPTERTSGNENRKGIFSL